LLAGHGGDVLYVDWHPNNSLLASSSRDGTVKLWDAREDASKAYLATLHGHKGPVNQVRGPI
jgi:polyadenylation factor subunit 2